MSLHLKNKLMFTDEFLCNVKDDVALRKYCTSLVEGTETLEDALQARVELIVLSIRMAEHRVPKNLYSFMPSMMENLQMKITKLRQTS